MKRDLLTALAVFLVGMAYFSLFLDYGMNFEDEGTLLYQFDRIAGGQEPYRDLHVGYTLGVYYVHSFLQGLFDNSVVPGRLLLALMNSTTMACLALIGMRMAGPMVGVVAALFYMSLPPVYTGNFASFNTPYPVWYNLAFWTTGLVCTQRFALYGSIRWLVAAGLAAGFGFFFKPNVGLFQLAASMMIVLSAVPPGAGGPSSELVRRLQKPWWWLVWASVLFGLFVVFAGSAGRREVVMLILPALACAVLVLWRSRTVAPVDGAPNIVVASACLTGAFLAVNLPWLGYFLSTMPLDRFIVRVMFVASGFEQYFFRPHPLVWFSCWLTIAAAAAAAVGPRLVRSAGLRATTVAFAGGAVAAVLFILVAVTSPMPKGLVDAVMSQFQEKIFGVTIGVHWVLLCAWVFGLYRARPERERRESTLGISVLSIGSIFLYLQVYPRSDIMHWVTSAPVTMTGAVVLLGLAAKNWSQGAGPLRRAAMQALFLAPVVFVAILRVSPGIATVVDVEGMRPVRPPAIELRSERAPIWMNVGRAQKYESLSQLIAFLHDKTEPDEKVFTFPSLDVVSFLAGRDNPTRHGYFFPRWPGHEVEAEVLAVLEERPPRFAVVLHEHSLFFSNAPVFYYALGEFLEKNYHPHVQIGRYAVLAHNRLGPAGTLEPPRSLSIKEALDPELHERVVATMGAGDTASKVRMLGYLRSLLLETDYPPVTWALKLPEQEVRDAAMRALARARDAEVGMALLGAVEAGRLSARERSLALRVIPTQISPEMVPVCMGLTQAMDPRIAEMAVVCLSYMARYGYLESFWPGRSTLPGTPLLGNDPRWIRMVRRWIQNPFADTRVRIFAAYVAGEAAAHRLQDEHVSMLCNVGDAPVAALEATTSGELSAEISAEMRASLAALRLEQGTCGREVISGRADQKLALFGRQLTAKLLFLLGMVRNGQAPVVAEQAVKLIAYDDMLAPRVALSVLREVPDAERYLIELIAADEPPGTRQRAAWLAALAGGERTMEALANAVDDSEAGTRMAIAWALGSRGGEAERGILERLSEDASTDVREFATVALRRMDARL